LQRLLKAIERLPEEFPAADEQAQARKLLENGLHEALEALQRAGKLSERRSPRATSSSMEQTTE
jgi:hypothetical protein